MKKTRKIKKNNISNFNRFTQVIDIKMRIIFIAVLAPIILTIFWGFFGIMQVRQDVNGVLIREGRIINIYALEDCVLLDFSIVAEQFIQKDYVIARFEHPDLITEINIMISDNVPSEQIDIKRKELYARSLLLSPESGRVVDTFVNTGDYVKKGQKLASLSKEASDSQAIECLLFVPADKMKNMQKGMRVNIYPSNVNSKLYGNMTGKITLIGEYPITKNYLIGLLGSEELASAFLSKGTAYEIYVNLDVSEETVTGYKWSTSFGPKQKFGNLTNCEAVIITMEASPIRIFLWR